jgi:hypothetical protein
MSTEEYVYCPMCPKHCITGVLALHDIPKNYSPDLILKDGRNLTQFCLANYEPEKK